MPEMLVVMFSCDKYAAAWEPFCHGFRKYWPDCPWPLVGVSNHLDTPCDKTVKVGEDKSWSHTVLRGMKRIRAPVILGLFEDHWITGPVDTVVLIDFARHVKRGDAVHIRLKAGDAKHVGDFHLDSRLVVAAPGERYRACLQPAFWSVPDFRKLLKPGETPWEFEQRSARRTGGSPKYLCVKSEHLPYAITPEWSRGVLKGGRWTDGAKKYAEREGLKIDFSRNPGG